jgi:hypothetical protein
MTVEEKNKMRERMRDITGGAAAALLFSSLYGGLGQIACIVLALALFVTSYAQTR